MKKFISVFVLLMIILGSTGFVSLSESSPTIKTKISGLSLTHSTSIKKSITDKVTLSPARKGKVYLQFYSKAKKKWVSKKSFKMSGSSNNKANVKIKFSNDWKKTLATAWRLYIPADYYYKKFVSNEITVFSRNIETLSLKSKSAVLIRADKNGVLYNKKMDKKRPNASTTKLMTALLALENGDMEQKVAISQNAATTRYGVLNASVGDEYYFKDLFSAMLICSSNDSAAAIGETIGNTTKEFSEMMNTKAEELGCKNTHFVNAHGLQNKKHYSSAYDLALIMSKDLNFKEFVKTIGKKTYSFKNVKKTKSYKFENTNILLKDYACMLGGKTGYTKKAGCCFCGAYKYKGNTYVFTVLGSKTSKGRWNDCKKIIDYIQKYS